MRPTKAISVSDQRKRGWFWGEDTVLADNGASAHAKLVYLGLAKHANESGRSWPSLTTLATATSLSRSTVKRGLDELEAMDPPRVRVDLSAGPNGVNVYVILGWPAPVEASSQGTGGVQAELPPQATAPTPNPVHTEPGQSTVDWGAVQAEPGGSSVGTTEGIPTEGIPREQHQQQRPPAPDVVVVVTDREGQEHQLQWPSGKTLVALFNARRPAHLAEVETLAGTRLEKANRYARMFPFVWWQEVFAQYDESNFLSGRTRPSPGHEHFTPDFDWLLSKGRDQIENCMKVHDGRYRRRGAAAAPTAASPARTFAPLTETDEAAIREAQSKLPWRAPARQRVEVDEEREHEELRRGARDQARGIGA